MAAIDYVRMEVLFDSPSELQVNVSYGITATLDDVPAGRAYRELVQLVKVGRMIGEPGVEHLVPEGTVWDGTVLFTGDEVGFEHSRQLTLPSADLAQASALAAEEIRARVTLIPFPAPSPSMESNTVLLNGPPPREQLA
ncbi:MAG: hypothetical protein ABR992_01255 [Solirubrobacteraceae bacterium]|jgi:hypothetical protein